MVDRLGVVLVVFRIFFVFLPDLLVPSSFFRSMRFNSFIVLEIKSGRMLFSIYFRLCLLAFSFCTSVCFCESTLEQNSTLSLIRKHTRGNFDVGGTGNFIDDVTCFRIQSL